jgi:O-antigen/teichoic acid export membrane protein
MRLSFHQNSSIWLQLPFMIGMLTGIISLPIVLKSLGSTDYGIYVLLIDIFGVLSILVKSMNTNFIRNIAKRDKVSVNSYYISNYSFLFLSIFFLSLLVFTVTSLFYEFRLSYLLLFISFFIALYSAFLNLYNYAKMLYRDYFFIDILFSLSNFILLLLLYYYEYLSFDSLVLINLGANVLKLIVVFVITSKFLQYKLIDLKLRLLKREYQSLKSFFIISIGTYLIFSVDSIVTSYLLDVSLVTFLVVHMKIPKMAMSMFYTFQDSKLPLYSKYLQEKQYELLYQTIRKHFMINILSVLILYSTMFFISGYVYNIWLGSSFIFDSNFYIICILVASIYSITHYMGMIANVFHQEKTTAKFILIEGVLNIVLSAVFASYYGIYGIVLGTLVAHIVVMFNIQVLLIIKNLKKLRRLVNEK